MKKFTKEDAMKGYKTREEINKAIEIVAKQNGLTVQKEKWACRDGVIGLDAENLNIFTEIDWNYNIHEDFVQYIFKVSFRASVSRMGANYTTEELREVANEINRVAVAVDMLNMMELEFVDVISK